jgi:lipoate-protein ligase A
MAVDEVLLESAARDGRATLRFYQWSEPTLSLGYFQRYQDRATHPASRDCACVRRLTGGGAILHDRELTYGLALPRSHPLSADAAGLYDVAHAALIRALARFGVEARIRIDIDEPPPAREAFLCFLRKTRGDVLFGQAKICGSAQRRRRGAVLQHGSLLLGRSPWAPEIPGIEELAGGRLAATELSAGWGNELASALGYVLESSQISAEEREAADTLRERKYAAELWNRRR